jgi:hypothetical protein
MSVDSFRVKEKEASEGAYAGPSHGWETEEDVDVDVVGDGNEDADRAGEYLPFLLIGVFLWGRPWDWRTPSSTLSPTFLSPTLLVTDRPADSTHVQPQPQETTCPLKM